MGTTPVEVETPKLVAVETTFSIQSWKSYGKVLARSLGNHLWELGDWLLSPETEFAKGELPEDLLKQCREYAAKVTGYSWGNLKNYAWVSRAIPPSRRRDGLSYSVHREVAKFEPKYQEHLLDYALRSPLDQHGRPVENNLRRPFSVREMRQTILGMQKDGCLPRTTKVKRSIVGADDDQRIRKPGECPPEPPRTVTLRIPLRDWYVLRNLAWKLVQKPNVADVIWWMAAEYAHEHDLANPKQRADQPNIFDVLK
jgi:hypothetical protein